MESGELSRGAHERVVLFHGVRDAAHQPYAARLLAWGADLGVRVVEVHSRPAPGWSGARGYVQDALEAERENLGDLSRAAAFVVGQKEMAEALKANGNALFKARDAAAAAAAGRRRAAACTRSTRWRGGRGAR